MAEETLDAEIDRLYGLPLDEFITQRDRLAKTLRGGGDRAAGAKVNGLRKPTAGAWALNQAVRRRRAETEALLAAGERLRAAHAALLSGGDRAEMREAINDQRTLASALADSAEAIASETGKSGPALKERVRATLYAAALDDEVREELARGRLVREREVAGLGAAFSSTPNATPAPAPASEPAARREPSERQRKRAAARAEAERLLAEAETALEEAEEAEEHASDRVQAARAALSDAEGAQRDAANLVRERRREHAKRERALRRMQE